MEQLIQGFIILEVTEERNYIPIAKHFGLHVSNAFSVSRSSSILYGFFRNDLNPSF